MNYFEIFGLPVQLMVDKSLLPKKYFELSKKFHPDFYSNATPGEQQHSLEISANLNKAFKTFQNPDETIKYVLKMKNLLEEEEKYKLSPTFLMEVLEINEQLMDADGQDATLNLKSDIEKLQNRIYEPVKQIIEHYQEGITSEKELLQVKEYYYQKKYLHRIEQQLKAMS
jgi:molecular chaperone HscB